MTPMTLLQTAGPRLRTDLDLNQGNSQKKPDERIDATLHSHHALLIPESLEQRI
jgi:hypothetical protein